MRRLQVILAACAALFLLGSCASYSPHDHMHENPNRWKKLPDKMLPIVSTWCNGVRCHRVIKFDPHCNAFDAANQPITQDIPAKIGTHICLFNETGCELVLKFGNVLFGPSNAVVTIPRGQCTTLLVTQEAANGTFSVEPICPCIEGRGHTNPTVKVGEDEEP
ncbi:MAG TPA: hypothetical protein VFH33_01380 [Candidatus Krumholzibacteria bacterium]|nr:hypothetical protein [Candidatus Krumholzibacteria bacterium]